MKRIKRQKAGFTLVELMIATTVFSVVLLLCTYGLLAVGRAYYKGLAISRTQENARAILADVAEALKYSPGEVIVNVTDPNNTDDSHSAHCIGTKRYSFRQYEEMEEGRHVLVSDTVSGCSHGVGIQSLDTPESLTASSRELLSPRMRLLALDIMRQNQDLYKVTVIIGTGRVGPTGVDFELDGSGCKNERGVSIFCTVTELSTTVHRRV